MGKCYGCGRISEILKTKLSPEDALNRVVVWVESYPRFIPDSLKVEIVLVNRNGPYFQIDYAFRLQVAGSANAVRLKSPIEVAGRLEQSGYPDSYGRLWTLRRNKVESKHRRFARLLVALTRGVRGFQIADWPKVRNESLVTDTEAIDFFLALMPKIGGIDPQSIKYRFVGKVHTPTSWHIEMSYRRIVAEKEELRTAVFSASEIYRSEYFSNRQYFNLRMWTDDVKASRVYQAFCFDLDTAGRWLEKGIPPFRDYGWSLSATDFADCWTKGCKLNEPVPSLAFASWLYW